MFRGKPGSELEETIANMGEDADPEEKLVLMGRLTAELRSRLSRLTI
jgi:hypothetical protein